MKKILLEAMTFVAVFMIFGCGRIENEGSTLSIDLSKPTKKTIHKYSDLISTSEFILLETDSSCFLSTNIDCYHTISGITIVDKKQNIIINFNPNGKKISRIDRRGLQSGGYVMIRDFSYDQVNDCFYILDSELHKLLRLSTNGDFIMEMSLNSNPTSMEVFNGQVVLFYPGLLSETNKYYSLAFLNSGDFRMFKRGKSSVDRIESSHFYYFKTQNNTLIYWEDIYEQIEEIDENGSIHSYKIYFSKNKMNIESFYNNKDFEKDITTKNHIYSVTNSRKYIFIKALKNRVNTYYIYNKLNGELLESEMPIIDECGEYPPFWPSAYFKDNSFYRIIDIISAKKQIASNKIKNKELIKLVSNIGISDNPIIQFSNIK